MAGMQPQSSYDRFRTFLEKSCGILLGDNKEYLVDSRMRPLLQKHNFQSLEDLFDYLYSHRASAAFKEEVVDAMTTNETLWFRDMHPFEVINNRLLPELSKRPGPINVWSAACSTGQEPYSFAIIADEYKAKNPGLLNQGVRIAATDISPTVLATARAGVYDMLVLGRGMSNDRLAKYFSEVREGAWRINSNIANQISFHSQNLLHSYGRFPDKHFDIIMCRNVLIYFSQELKMDILERMHAKLKPGGYLFLGASESLNGLPDKFEIVQCKPGIVYRAK